VYAKIEDEYEIIYKGATQQKFIVINSSAPKD